MYVANARLILLLMFTFIGVKLRFKPVTCEIWSLNSNNLIQILGVYFVSDILNLHLTVPVAARSKA